MMSQETSSGLERGLTKAVDWLGREQHEDGHWVAQLQSNCAIEAEWVLAMHFLGVTDDPKYDEVVRCLLNEQRPDGSWEVYHGAPSGDLNATVECYAALRAAGHDPQSDPLVRARAWIFERGGLKGTRVFTKIWLALLGEWPWQGTPTLPPEIIYLPPWCPFNIYQFSSWARATIVALTILSARRPVRPLPPERRLDELFPRGREGYDYSLPRKGSGWSLEAFFHLSDRLLERYARLPFQPGRETAIALCRDWIVRHQEADGCWGGIQPPWIYSLMALHTEGFALDHPVMEKGIRAFDPPWAVPTERGTYLQACLSPVWDTVLCLLALADCRLDCSTPMVEKAVDWILQEQIRAPGDWQMTVKGVRPGGWAFEYENDWYPDVDDTAVAVLVLARLKASHPRPERVAEAIDRGLEWLLGMRCSNGAWAAFDRDNDSPLVSLIPFCDFGETLDPPSVDVTAHVVEALGAVGRDLSDPVVSRAVEYMRSEQEPDGSWFGRWGVNYIYGTAAVLPALHAVGENMQADYVRKAADWIVSRQNADGGWGESCASYMDDSLRGKGASTASQTGWALMALLAVGSEAYRQPIEAGLDYLLKTQREDGTWDEAEFTGTGFPGYGLGARTDLTKAGTTLPQGKELSRGFMIRYHMYRHYFPLMAMGRAREALRNRAEPAYSGR